MTCSTRSGRHGMGASETAVVIVEGSVLMAPVPEPESATFDVIVSLAVVEIPRVHPKDTVAPKVEHSFQYDVKATRLAVRASLVLCRRRSSP